MRIRTLLVGICLAATLGLGVTFAAPMGTAFTYQGQLTAGNQAANGLYDFSIALFDSALNGSQLGPTVVTNGVPVTNGLFMVGLDFGGSPFDGSARWLDLSFRTNGVGSFTPLTPRQPLTPVPYALFASNAVSAQAAVTANGVAAGAVTTAGLQDAAVTAAKISAGQVVKSLNGLTDAVTLSAGNNITLTPSGNNLQISANLPTGAGWLLTGNAGTGPGNFLGTTDLQPLDLVVDGHRAFHLEPSNPAANEVNVVGGSASNTVSTGTSGATIGGGGSFSAYSSSGQWLTNDYRNVVSAGYATLGGGIANGIMMNAYYATLVGGAGNLVQPNGQWAFLGGGLSNSVAGLCGTLSGGAYNSAGNYAATVGGGIDNAASGAGAFVGGGGYDGFVAMGNTASGPGSLVAGGTQNTASGSRSTVGGGHDNAATNWYATVPGGAWNVAGGMGSFAAGQAAKAVHDGTFVWGDNDSAFDMVSTAPNQFLIRAAGGVGIGLNNPQSALDVAGTVTASSFQGPGAVSWQTVSGTAQQAQPNCGYVVMNASQVTITLPASPNTGDVIRVTGAGAGGWKIAQNPSQAILAQTVAGAATTPGTAGYLTGAQNTAIELQYVGNNQFLPLRHEGKMSAN